MFADVDFPNLTKMEFNLHTIQSNPNTVLIPHGASQTVSPVNNNVEVFRNGQMTSDNLSQPA